MWAHLIIPVMLLVSGRPGEAPPGVLPALNERETNFAAELKGDLKKLAGDIGERNSVRYKELVAAAEWIEAEFKTAGYEVSRQPYKIRDQVFWNIIAEKRGANRPDEIVVIGAHYDSVINCPGANDNGTGVVATLALARAMRNEKPDRTLRFVAFVNEEPPFFWTRNMGSLVYTRACAQKRERIVGMLSLETMGYFSDIRGSQRYPFPLKFFYPSTGNFIAFVSDLESRQLLNAAHEAFAQQANIPSMRAAMPRSLPGVGWSDHWAFWQIGVPALMITDTAPFRYRHYHTPEDTVDKIDYARLARVVAGLEHVARRLCRR